MIPKINSVEPISNYRLVVAFDDGRKVMYDVKTDIRELPGYSVLETVAGLFEMVKLDASRTCVYWNEEVDLPSDAIYEYGEKIT